MAFPWSRWTRFSLQTRAQLGWGFPDPDEPDSVHRPELSLDEDSLIQMNQILSTDQSSTWMGIPWSRLTTFSPQTRVQSEWGFPDLAEPDSPHKKELNLDGNSLIQMNQILPTNQSSTWMGIPWSRWTRFCPQTRAQLGWRFPDPDEPDSPHKPELNLDGDCLIQMNQILPTDHSSIWMGIPRSRWTRFSSQTRAQPGWGLPDLDEPDSLHRPEQNLDGDSLIQMNQFLSAESDTFWFHGGRVCGWLGGWV